MGRQFGRSRVSAAMRAVLPVAAAAAVLTFASGARAAEGLPDPTFGSGGFTVLDEPDLTNEFLTDVVVLPDGKILAGGNRGGAGGFLLARFNPDGSPDLSFGPEGFRVEPDLDNAGDPRAINDLARLGDGRIVAAGLGRGPAPEKVNAFATARYLASGQLDPDFGDAGLSVQSPEGPGEAEAMDIAPGGKIVLAGERIGSLFHPEVAVLRLDQEGEPDASFAPAAPVGFRLFQIPGSDYSEARAVRVLGDGSIIVGGESQQGAFLAKLDSEGEPVAGFGTAGFAVQDLGEEADPSGEITDIAIQPDGRIVVAGSAFPATNTKSELVVARFTAGGQLDPTFGSGGIFRLDATAGYDEGRALSLLPDGRIVVAGFNGTRDTWILRLTPNGQLDPSFGTGGQTVASASPMEDGAEGLAIQPDGRPVIAGAAETPGGIGELLVGRFTGPETVKVSLVPTSRRCGGRTATISGTEGADRLRGTRKADVIVGLGGNDRISSLAGNDVVCGGAGRDAIDLGKGRDEAFGEAGKDTLRGGPGKDKLLGAAGKDKLLGGPGQDICNGGAGKDPKSAGCEVRKKLP